MVTVLGIVHVIICVIVVLMVLIQDPKGGAAGGMFGGGGGADSLFGATGAPSFLAKLTRWTAVAFAVSCLAMMIYTKPDSNSVLDGRIIPQATESAKDQAVETPASEAATSEAPQESSEKAPESTEGSQPQ